MASTIIKRNSQACHVWNVAIWVHLSAILVQTKKLYTTTYTIIGRLLIGICILVTDYIVLLKIAVEDHSTDLPAKEGTGIA